MKLKHSFFIACLSITPLFAQQADSKAAAPKSATPSDNNNPTTPPPVKDRDNGESSRHHHRNIHGMPNARDNPTAKTEEMKPVPYIGVMTREVSPELRTQFSLQEGFGLVVEEVMPDSPAARAGVKVHDILVKFEDQQLVSMEQLKLLVRSKHKGDSASLTLITLGKEKQLPLVLGEHLMAITHGHAQPSFPGWPHTSMPFMNGNFNSGMLPGVQNQSREFNEQMERFQKEMREYQQRIQDWARQGSNGLMPQPPMLNMPGFFGQPQRGSPRVSGGVQMQPMAPGGSTRRFNFSESHAATNITRRDDSGEYTLKTEDGKTTFTARPSNGKEQSWPVNNDAERNAVPQEFRDKLRMMDSANSGGAAQPPPASGGVNQTPHPAKNSKSATSA